MDAEFNQQLERILGGGKEVLDLRFRSIGNEGAHSVSTVLMNENNKVIALNLRQNNIGDEGVKSLSTV